MIPAAVLGTIAAGLAFRFGVNIRRFIRALEDA